MTTFTNGKKSWKNLSCDRTSFHFNIPRKSRNILKDLDLVMQNITAKKGSG